MDIVCRKQSCKNNDCTKCCLKHIHVNGSADCTDMAIDSTKAPADMSKDMFTKPPTVAPYKHCLTVSIECGADCIHNRRGECYSNGIIVNAVEKLAECVSYVKK